MCRKILLRSFSANIQFDSEVNVIWKHEYSIRSKNVERDEDYWKKPEQLNNLHAGPQHRPTFHLPQ